MHGASKRRTWRKVHIVVCPKFHRIVLNELTESNVSDTEVGANLFVNCPKTQKKPYEEMSHTTRKAVIKPRKTVV